MEEVKLCKCQQRVFDYLVENGSITPLDAIVDLGETRLAARICELKKKGIIIHTDRITVKNRRGEPRNVCKYYL